MKKFSLALPISLIIVTHLLPSEYQPTKCILPPTSHGPVYLQAHNTELDIWRSQISKEMTTEWQGTERIKAIDFIRFIREDLSDTYRCFQYAIETITGFNGYIELPDNPKNATIDLAKYFEQVKTIEKNDLIIYTTSEKDHTIHHFAAAVNPILFQSKCGAWPQIFEHLPFGIHYAPAKAIWSFRLKEEYQGPSGNKHLVKEMRADITKALHTYILEQQAFNKEQLALNKQRPWLFPAGFALGSAYILFLTMMHNKSN